MCLIIYGSMKEAVFKFHVLDLERCSTHFVCYGKRKTVLNAIYERINKMFDKYIFFILSFFKIENIDYDQQSRKTYLKY